MKRETTAPSTEPKPKREISPEIAALRKEHADKVAAFKASQASAATLKTITEKLLPKLTADDLLKLHLYINATQTAPA